MFSRKVRIVFRGDSMLSCFGSLTDGLLPANRLHRRLADGLDGVDHLGTASPS